MSCKQNDILVDMAIDRAEDILKLKPPVSDEVRRIIEEEIFKSLKEDEGDPGDYEPHTYEEMEKADAYWESLRKGEDEI